MMLKRIAMGEIIWFVLKIITISIIVCLRSKTTKKLDYISWTCV